MRKTVGSMDPLPIFAEAWTKRKVLDGMDNKMNVLDNKMNALAKQLHEKIAALNKKIDTLDAKIDAIGANINTRMDRMEALLAPAKHV